MATRKPAAPKTAKAKKPAAKRAPAKKPANKQLRGSSSEAERRAHNPEVARSTRAPATKTTEKLLTAQPAPDPNPKGEDGLTPSVRLFVEEYTIDRNATRAYVAAFPDVKRSTAATEGWKLLRNPEIRAAIDRRFDEALTKLATSREELIGRLVAIATADPNELCELRLTACECCWGGSIDNKRPAFWKDAPDPDCSACGGDGMPREHFHDTRHLSPKARALYAGVKRTKEGLQVLMQDQGAARESLMKHLGLYEKDNAQKGAAEANALATFLSSLHGAGATKIKPVAATPRERKGPDA